MDLTKIPRTVKIHSLLFTHTLTDAEIHGNTQKYFGEHVRACLDGGGKEGSRVELAENRLILGQIYSTLFYSTSLPLNPNGPLKNQGTMREKKWRAVVLIWQKTMVLISSKTILMKEVE